MKYPNRIRILRKRADLKVEDLAARFNMTESNFYKLERGGNRLDMGLAKQLSELFGCRLSDLIVDNNDGVEFDDELFELAREVAIKAAEEKGVNDSRQIIDLAKKLYITGLEQKQEGMEPQINTPIARAMMR